MGRASEKLGSRREKFALVIGRAQQAAEAFPHGWVVVDHEYQWFHRVHTNASSLFVGWVKEKRAPPPSALSTVMVPEWASMIERTMARPIPSPSDFVVKNWSNKWPRTSSRIP